MLGHFRPALVTFLVGFFRLSKRMLLAFRLELSLIALQRRVITT